MVVAAGLVVLAALGGFYFLQMQRLSRVEDDLAAQETRNAQLEQQVAELQQFADLQAELEAKQLLLSTLFVNEVSWSSALLDVSRVIPDSSYLTSLTGTISVGGAPAGPEVAPGTPETTLIGNMSFQGVALGTETIATWLTRLEQVQGWVNSWVSTAQESGSFTRVYDFTSGLDLAVTAATDRGQGGLAP